MKKFSALLYLILILAFSITSCQDDPVLEPEDGNQVITPKTRALITTIQLNDFPDLDPNGATWDNIDLAAYDTLGLPDIFFNITTPGANPAVLWTQNSHFSNTGTNDTVPFYLLSPFEIIPFGSNIDVNIYDFELPDSTLMGTVNFFIGAYPDPNEPYPAFINSQQNGYDLTIGVQWLD